HNSTRAAELQPYNSKVRPEVDVTFEVGGQPYSLSKSFCVKPEVRFTTPHGVYEGPQAEEEVASLMRLGSQQKAVRGKDPADSTLVGFLGIKQAREIDNYSWEASGKQTIQSALEAEIGSVLGGGDGHALIKNIKARHDKFFTEKTGAENKEYKEAL